MAAPVTNYHYSEEVVATELHDLILHGINNGAFRSDYTGEETPYVEVVKRCLNYNHLEKLRFFAVFLWINEKDPIQNQKLNDYFSNKTNEFQNQLVETLIENMREYPKTTAEALLKFPPEILGKVFENFSYFLRDFLDHLIQSNFPQERKEELFARINAEVPDSCQYFYLLMVQAYTIDNIKKCSFYEPYKSSMSERVTRDLESARLGSVVPMPENMAERKYYISVLVEQDHPYLFLIVSHFDQKDWSEICYEKKFYANCLCNASLLAGTEPQNRERMCKFFELLTEMRYPERRFSTPQKFRNVKMEEVVKQFAANLTPCALSIYSPSFHELLSSLIIRRYIEKDPAKLAAWLLYTAEHHPESLKKLVDSTKEYEEFYIYLLFETPFSPFHLVILSKFTSKFSSSSDHAFLELHLCLINLSYEKSIPRINLWFEHMPTLAVELPPLLFCGNPELDVTPKFRSQGLCIKLRDAAVDPESALRKYIMAKFPREILTLDVTQSRIERRNLFIAALDKKIPYKERLEEIYSFSSDDNPWEMLEWIIERLEPKYKTYVLVYYGQFFSQNPFGLFGEINEISLGTFDSNDSASLLGIDHAASSTWLFTDEERFINVMLDLILCYMTHPMEISNGPLSIHQLGKYEEKDLEEVEFMQSLYMALCDSKTFYKVFSRLKSQLGEEAFLRFILRFKRVCFFIHPYNFDNL